MTTATERQALVDAIGSYRNTWMPSFGFASYHIAEAVADGRIPELTLVNFVPYDVNGAGTIARLAGLEYMGDEPGTGKTGGWASGYQVDCEDVSIACDAIRSLVEYCFQPADGAWQFYEDDLTVPLEELDRIRMEMGMSYREAAQLIVDADTAYIASVRA